ncbi:hypothetical protein Athai_30740 [Actinocatenispora thailandica]|uniref:Acetylornithine aminotransferase n=1 Tax=Actinocatenispora thailandica TaxID=227318 RepID=A0A7R7HXC1_9ACTN|nr:hypothetical protein Athai_30740 [Actinocatenispora thailandica]
MTDDLVAPNPGGDPAASNGGDLVARWDAAVLHNYGTPAVALVRGDGAVVTDEHGRDYLDLFAGIAVNALGHAHPAIVSAVSEQIATLGHVGNFFANPPQVALAERLLALFGRPARCTSPTPGPRPTRRRSSCPGAPVAATSCPPWTPSTAVPWVRSR